MSARHSRVLIIGSGPAGYTAAIYAARAMLKPLLIQGVQPGGQLTITTDVENYPGFADVIQGPWLMEQMRAQAEHVGTEIDHRHYRRGRSRRSGLPAQRRLAAQVYTADALIIATGAQAKLAGLPSEEKFKGFGVSACATCDGFFYRDKEVLVVGGGNTAVEEALFLTNFASKVTVVHRRDEFRAERILQERLFAHPKIEVIWNTGLDEILGADDAAGASPASRLREPRRPATTADIAVDGVFIAIGHAPGDRAVRGPARHEAGRLHLVTDPDSTATSHSRRLCRGRRHRRDLPPGGDRRRHGLHGGARSRALAPCRANRCAEAAE